VGLWEGFWLVCQRGRAKVVFILAKIFFLNLNKYKYCCGLLLEVAAFAMQKTLFLNLKALQGLQRAGVISFSWEA
jgi:hypothetical protein